MTEIKVPKCGNCGSDLVERETKNKRKIYACPNWRPDGKGCKGDIYDPNRQAEHDRKYPRVLIRWNVPSRSEPGKNRTVEIYEDGSMRCNCWAGEVGKFCFHQQTVLKELENLLARIRKENCLNPKVNKPIQ